MKQIYQQLFTAKKEKRKLLLRLSKFKQRSRLQAFTLLECMILLLLIPGIVLIFSVMILGVQKMSGYWKNSEEKNWHLFVQQFDGEWRQAKDYKIEEKNGLSAISLKYFPIDEFKKEEYQGRVVTYYLNTNSHELVRANENYRGFEPVLSQVKSALFYKEEGRLVLRVIFLSDKIQEAMWGEKKERWLEGN